MEAYRKLTLTVTINANAKSYKTEDTATVSATETLRHSAGRRRKQNEWKLYTTMYRSLRSARTSILSL